MIVKRFSFAGNLLLKDNGWYVGLPNGRKTVFYLKWFNLLVICRRGKITMTTN